MSDITYDHKILIVRSPDRSLVCIIRDGIVTESTSQHYIGRTEDYTKLALGSLLRYWNEEAKDNEYPEMITL